MTEDELRKEATSTTEWEAVPMIDRPLFVFAYVKGAEPREKRIAELEAYNEKLLDSEIEKHNKVVELEKELKVEKAFCEKACEGADQMYKDLKVAKDLIKNIIRVTWGEGWNYSLDWKVKAEAFLKEE